jgi:hypothetical protein
MSCELLAASLHLQGRCRVGAECKVSLRFIWLSPMFRMGEGPFLIQTPRTTAPARDCIALITVSGTTLVHAHTLPVRYTLDVLRTSTVQGGGGISCDKRDTPLPVRICHRI